MNILVIMTMVTVTNHKGAKRGCDGNLWGVLSVEKIGRVVLKQALFYIAPEGKASISE